jgi:hypothetical protein
MKAAPLAQALSLREVCAGLGGAAAAAAGCDYRTDKRAGVAGGSTYLAYLSAALLRAGRTAGALVCAAVCADADGRGGDAAAVRFTARRGGPRPSWLTTRGLRGAG